MVKTELSYKATYLNYHLNDDLMQLKLIKFNEILLRKNL